MAAHLDLMRQWLVMARILMAVGHLHAGSVCPVPAKYVCVCWMPGFYMGGEGEGEGEAYATPPQ